MDTFDSYLSETTKTLTNKTLTAPKFVNDGFIADANGHEMLVFNSATSPKNALKLTNSAAGDNVIIGAFGDDDVGITITPKGTGKVNISTGNLNYAGTTITATGAELNILGGSITPGTVTVAGTDGIVTNDDGTMRQTEVDTFDSYLSETTKTLTNKTLTAPKFANDGFIADKFGNEMLVFKTNTSSAKNALKLTNSVAGGDVIIGAFGDNNNVGITITPKGTGAVNLPAAVNLNGVSLSSTLGSLAPKAGPAFTGNMTSTGNITCVNMTCTNVLADSLYTLNRSSGTFTGGYNRAWFTGSHGNNNNFNFNVNIEYNGLIVSCIDQYINQDYSMKPTISESIPLTKLTNIENDKAVFGVVAYQQYVSYNINNFKVNSLGEGAMWITNKNGNLDIGDYISSSIITGYGQRQNDDLLHNYTVAKITCNCDFSIEKQIKQKIITISNENYIEQEYVQLNQSKEINYKQNIVYAENGDIQFEDDLDPSGNKVYEYEFETRFLEADGTIIESIGEYMYKLSGGINVFIACFVGCTYHCG